MRAPAVARRLAVGLALAVLCSGLTIGMAESASASVLVNRPDPRVCKGEKITVGVWYRTWDGGARGYRLKVKRPGGKVVLRKHGKAPTQWKDWKVKAKKGGTYKTVYRSAKGAKKKWKLVYRSKSRNCS